MTPDVLGQVLCSKIIARERLPRYMRSAGRIIAQVPQHVRSVLELGNRLSTFQIDDRRRRVNREAPQLVFGYQRVIDGIEPVIGYLASPVKGVVEGLLRDDSQRIFSAVYGRLASVIV